MIVFNPSEPVDVPMTKGGVDRATVAAGFWARVPERDRDGCYVFAVPRKRGAEGLAPIYVGKTNRSFSVECFCPGNLSKINEYLRHHPATSLTLILLPHPRQRGGSNSRVIADVERELIQMARDVNPHLANKQHVHPDVWGIRGIIRGGRGKLGPGAIQLAQMLQVP